MRCGRHHDRRLRRRERGAARARAVPAAPAPRSTSPPRRSSSTTPPAAIEVAGAHGARGDGRRRHAAHAARGAAAAAEGHAGQHRRARGAQIADADHRAQGYILSESTRSHDSRCRLARRRTPRDVVAGASLLSACGACTDRTRVPVCRRDQRVACDEGRVHARVRRLADSGRRSAPSFPPLSLLSDRAGYRVPASLTVARSDDVLEIPTSSGERRAASIASARCIHAERAAADADGVRRSRTAGHAATCSCRSAISPTAPRPIRAGATSISSARRPASTISTSTAPITRSATTTPSTTARIRRGRTACRFPIRAGEKMGPAGHK